MSRFSISVFQCFSVFGALAVLWFRLIDHLRVEWTVNPQYGYGWAVPFLCLWMLWRRGRGHELELRQPRMDTDEHGCRRIKPRNTPNTRNEDTNSTKGHEFEGWRRMGWVRGLGFWVAALLYLPTRLIQEANPEWRLVSWALAIEVITLTFYLLRSISFEVPGSRFQVQSPQSTVHGPKSTVQTPRSTVPSAWCLLLRRGYGGGGIRGASLAFPLLFFLVAVPWPTVIEQPIVQGLTGANTAVTVEAVGLLGVPALQHGNRIEVGSGMVGIDEGCSGIRSLQVTLMLSLFFGEVYRLRGWRRVWVCLAGFGLAFAFNVGRTTALTWIAANKGTAAMANWHDPLGVGVLVGCFATIWMVGRGGGGEAEKLKC